jgi:ParB family chromosome partitioning protein
MTMEMVSHLKESIVRFGLVENLVVRTMADKTRQVLSGNQRLKALKELGIESVPCVVVELDDANAKLLAQALNQIQGEDDPGRRAQLLRDVLVDVTDEQVLKVLPETAVTLRQIGAMGTKDLASHLSAWTRAKSKRLQHFTFQLTDEQKSVVDRALASAGVVNSDAPTNPNDRGNRLAALCREYLRLKEQNDE